MTGEHHAFIVQLNVGDTFRFIGATSGWRYLGTRMDGKAIIRCVVTGDEDYIDRETRVIHHIIKETDMATTRDEDKLQIPMSPETAEIVAALLQERAVDITRSIAGVQTVKDEETERELKKEYWRCTNMSKKVRRIVENGR